MWWWWSNSSTKKTKLRFKNTIFYQHTGKRLSVTKNQMIRTQQPHGQQQEQQHETIRHNATQRETNETTIQRDSNKKGQADDDE